MKRQLSVLVLTLVLIIGIFTLVSCGKDTKCKHELVLVPETLPDCLEPGCLGYYRCGICGKTYQDPKALWPVKLKDLTSPPTGHTFSSEWAYDKDLHWYPTSCAHTEIKGAIALHSFGSWAVITPAGCENEGLKRRFCICGAAEEVAIPMSDHRFSETFAYDADRHWHFAVCGHSSEVSGKEGHTFGDWQVLSEPTCGEEGIKMRKCFCGAAETLSIDRPPHTYSDKLTFDEDHHWYGASCGHSNEISGKSPHAWGDWQVLSEPTCEYSGIKERSCHCGAVQYETKPQLEHTASEDWSYDEHEHWHSALCCDGLQTDRASHQWENEQLISAPTCITDGEMLHKCICGKTKTETIPADGHSFSAMLSYDDIGHWYGAVCEHTDERSAYSTHLWSEWEITAQPTCGEKGRMARRCICGADQEKEIEMLEHAFAPELSHDENGHWYNSLCGHGVIDGPYPHEWSEWETVKEADCELDGAKLRDCLCGARQEEVIQAPGHSYSSEWSNDETHHWHAADCSHTELTSGFERHIYGEDNICGLCLSERESLLLYELCFEETYYSVIGRGSVIGGSITIPATYKGKPVIEIDYEAFKDDTALTEITIPQSIKTIGRDAFSGCINLQQINFNATYMEDLPEGNGVFALVGQASGTKVTFGENVKRIPARLFAPESVNGLNIQTYIGINEVEFDGESQCESIGEGAFASCVRLDSFTVQKSVKRIEAYAFTYLGYISGEKSIIKLENKHGWSASDGRDNIDDVEFDSAEQITEYLTDTYRSYTWTRADILQNGSYALTRRRSEFCLQSEAYIRTKRQPYSVCRQELKP